MTDTHGRDRSPEPTLTARESSHPTVCGRPTNHTDRPCILHADHAGACEPLRRLDITDVVAMIEPADVSDDDHCTLCCKRLKRHTWKLVLPEVRLNSLFGETFKICPSCASELGSHLLKIPSGPAPEPSTTDDPEDWHPRA